MDFETYLQEPLELGRVLARFLDRRAPLVIFEVGACEGEDTIRLSRHFPNARIYAFEPLPENAAKVRSNLEKHGVEAAEVFELALSDTTGTTTFHVSSGHPEHLPRTEDWDYGNKSSSLLPPKQHIALVPWIAFDRAIEVETMRLDEFCVEHAVDTVDLAFLDVQGAELMVLRGAGASLRRIRAIWMEVAAVELYQGQPLAGEVERFMRDNGFVCIEDTLSRTAGDRLYVNRDSMTRGDVLVARVARRARRARRRLTRRPRD